MVASPQEWRDVCFSLPAVRSLSTENRKVTILCPRSQEKFWQPTGVAHIISYSEKDSARVIARFLVDVERALLWEAGKPADACARAGISELIGLPAPKLEKLLTRKLERRTTPGPPEHHVQRMLESAELLGAEPLQGQYFRALEWPIEAQTEVLLVVPDSDYGANYEWILEEWLKVVTWLKDKGWQIHIGKLREGGLSDSVAKGSSCPTQTIDLANPDSFAGYPLCLSADGSLPHLAGAFGAKCAVLFGPGDPVLTRPLSQRHLIIRKKVECSPCFLEKCPIDLRCQNDLDATRVIQLLQTLSPA